MDTQDTNAKSTQPASAQSDAFFEQVHADLRSIAQRQLSRERVDHTLQATALVNEVFLRLRSEAEELRDEPRRFFGLAAESMRRILIDHARAKKSQKRGGGFDKLSLDLAVVAQTASLDEVMQVDEAIQELGVEYPRAAELVRLRFFCGMDVAEAAKTMELSERTVHREWTLARAWLFRRLSQE